VKKPFKDEMPQVAAQRRVLARALAEDLDAVSGGCPDGTVTSHSCGSHCDQFDSDTAKLCDDQP
jgi:hypothetical protein